MNLSTCSGRSHLAVPSAGVALVGDAGHGVTPNLGQGCNAALETAAILGRVGSAALPNKWMLPLLTPIFAGHDAAAQLHTL
jgi:2-polyprenyl-6-methoxyphenol hydroxylase-like FAD-dependent oxidoreductase